MTGWLAVPRDWIASLGDIAKFAARDFREVFGLRVFRFFGEALRQAGILILSSTIVIWGLVFIIGLQCGIEGAYFNRSVGAPAYAGVFSAWCDLRLLRVSRSGRLVVGQPLARRVLAAVLGVLVLAFSRNARHRHPPIGARGLAPQKSWVPSIPMRCTSTMFMTMDLAVAVPTPTGPPLAL